MEVPVVLSEQSVLTDKQVESLLSYMKVTAGEMRLREAAASRSAGGVTVGSYYRTVQQARRKVRASVVTVLIAVQIGLVGGEDLRRLFELVGQGKVELSDEAADRFLEVFQVLLDKIVA